MGWNFAELKAATTTRARAPSYWLIAELFSYTEQEELFFECSSMVKQVLARHGTSQIFAWHFSRQNVFKIMESCLLFF
jgi:hypothetical protein